MIFIQQKLLKDNLFKLIFKYGVPSILTMWIFSLYTIVDGIFIGKFLGAQSLAAVNIVMPYVNFSFAIGIMVAVGSSTMIAIQLGAGEDKKALKSYSTSIQLFIVFSSILSLVGIIFPEKVVTLLGANDVILEEATTYLFYLSFFTLFYMLSYGFESFVRIEGSPNYSLLCILGGAIMNIVLDYFLIAILDMGIKGAAIATGTAQMTTALMLAYYMIFRAKKLKYSFIKFNPKTVMTILYNGSSEFLTEMATGVVIMAFNINIMNIIGNEGISAFSVISYISTLVTMTMIGFSQGLQPIISFNYGAQYRERVLKILKIGTITVFALGIFFFFLVNLFSDTLVGVFIKDNPRLFLLTEEAVTYYSFTYILMGINIIISSYFTAVENAFISSILSVLRGLIFINILLLLLPGVLDTKGIWLSAPVNELIMLVVSSVFFIKNGYKKIVA
ncbi:MATE family efflux transporter [Cetobacterium sp.]|uniref:MATE family efflux transporter n=1 Tax=Cetobacterium sp. TaxID=2071632 RepID=UPI003EE6A606